MADKIGYARVSTADQNADLQTDALTEAGCARIFTDTITGTATQRPQLAAALDYLRSGDTLVVWRLDRLGRSLRHLIETIDGLGQRDISFLSLNDNIDTTTPGGMLIFHIIAAIAEFERQLIQERAAAGAAAARARGRPIGRPRSLTDEQIAMVRSAAASGDTTKTQIARNLGVSRTTIHRVLTDTTDPTPPKGNA